jgi:hypothetical protein
VVLDDAEGITLGGLSDKALLAGLLNILYMWTTLGDSSGSKEGSVPVPEAPSESLRVK